MTNYRIRLFAGTALLALAVTTASVPSPAAAAGSAGPGWQPKVSERLVKLPPAYMKKSLERDFARSALGQAVQDIEGEIALKTQTLADLQNAIGQADGEVLVELKHQFLAEKRSYIDMVRQKQDLQRKQVTTRHKVLERLLVKLNRKAGGTSVARQKLADQQTAARQRFNGSIERISSAAQPHGGRALDGRASVDGSPRPWRQSIASRGQHQRRAQPLDAIRKRPPYSGCRKPSD